MIGVSLIGYHLVHENVMEVVAYHQNEVFEAARTFSWVNLPDPAHSYIDTRDPALDAAFWENILVISGYRIAQRRVIWHPDTCVTK